MALWVYDGQKVRYTRRNKTKVLCTVAVAAGDSARIINPLFKIDRWVDVVELEVVEEDADGIKPG